ncbi:hypothetical protein Forpe1208_v009935 [Fusarium oxysporum f. sp. rapae]|nr:hypothetical protein Forpe1208_v009935 [Fusarium oxysporum f. sp. rapae]
MIGFGTDQVYEYVKHMEPERHKDIQSFLSSRPLIEDLVRIPIQLDALCYGWDQVHNQGPETMTDLYQSIEKGLWRKDIVRLGKSKTGSAVTEDDKVSDTEVEELIENERILVEQLAFTGLCNNIVEFQDKHVTIICRYISTHSTFVDKTLPKLSFLRTSDSSVGKPSRTYHFLHLTLQEYFAARYFVRIWLQNNKADLVCINFDQNEKLHASTSSHTAMKPKDFFAQNKYSSRYNIMWRFATGLLHSGRNGSDELALHFLRYTMQGVEIRMMRRDLGREKKRQRLGEGEPHVPDHAEAQLRIPDRRSGPEEPAKVNRTKMLKPKTIPRPAPEEPVLADGLNILEPGIPERPEACLEAPDLEEEL